MPTVQSSYVERTGRAVAGAMANPHTCDADTYEAEEAIGFGVAVKRGTGDHQCELGCDGASTSPFAVTNFLGIAIKDPARDPEDGDKFTAGGHVSVMWRGDIWVKTGGAVKKGDDVSVVEATGVLSTVTAADGQFSIPGAMWMTDASSGGLAILRLHGNEAKIATT